LGLLPLLLVVVVVLLVGSVSQEDSNWSAMDLQ
jgi:hypothetical protein